MKHTYQYNIVHTKLYIYIYIYNYKLNTFNSSNTSTYVYRYSGCYIKLDVRDIGVLHCG